MNSSKRIGTHFYMVQWISIYVTHPVIPLLKNTFSHQPKWRRRKKLRHLPYLWNTTRYTFYCRKTLRYSHPFFFVGTHPEIKLVGGTHKDNCGIHPDFHFIWRIYSDICVPHQDIHLIVEANTTIKTSGVRHKDNNPYYWRDLDIQLFEEHSEIGGKHSDSKSCTPKHQTY